VGALRRLRMSGLAANGRLVVGNANLLRLGLGWGGWITGEAAYVVALLVIAYQRGGTTAVAVVSALRVVPAAFLAPVGAVLADRYPRAAVIAGVQAGWAALMLVMTAAVALKLSLAAVDVLVVVTAAVSSPLRPAVNALIAQLVDRPEELTAANSLYSFVEAAGTLLGPVLAAVLLGVTSDQMVFLGVALILAITASATSGIATEFRLPVLGRSGGWRAAALEPLLGFATVSRTAGVRLIVALFAAQAMMRGLLNVFVVVAAVSALALGQAGVGSLLAVVGAGGIAGSLASMTLIRRRGLAPAFAGGLSLWGLPLVFIGLWTNRPVALVALAALGVGNAVEDVSGFTLFQRVLPDHLLGRAFGALWASVTLAMAIGSLLAAPMVSAMGLRRAMIISGTALLVMLALSWRALRHLDRHVVAPERELALLRALPLFKPLPLVSIERLARSLHREQVHEGVDVVRQGDRGDRYYVVDHGRFGVSVDGREARTLGPGDSFGEIALLRQERRSATVRALEDGEVYWLDGRTFVLVVTGHGPTDRTALDIAHGHLAADRERLSR
jgi:MFS family permease